MSHDPSDAPSPLTPHAHDQARLALLLSQVDAATWTTDAELRVTSMDGLGFRREETLGRHACDIVPAAEALLRRVHERALAGRGESFDLELEGRVYRARVEPLRSDGAIVGVAGVAQDVTERRRNERELTRQRAFLQAVIDATPAAIFTKDAHGRYTLANRMLAEMYGRTTAEVTGATDEVLDAALAAEWREADARVLLSQRTVSLPEYRMQQPDGTHRWFHTVKVPLHIPGDPQPQVLGIAMDITERREMERALTEQSERFRKVVEQSLAGIYVLDEGSFEYVNPRFAQVFGYEPWEITGECSVNDLVVPEDREKVQAMIRARLHGGARSMHYGFRGLKRDGSIVHVEVHGGPVGEGENRRILGVLLDVTAEMEAEQRLYNQERRFRSLTENLQDVVLVTDAKDELQYVSPSIEQVLGYSVPEVMFRPLMQFVHPEDRRLVEQGLESTRQDGAGGVVVTFRAQHRDGSWRLVESSARDLSGDSAIAGVVVSLRDVTERVALQEQLRQAQKMEAVGQLAGGVAHDFNNILTAIHGYVELLLEELEPGSELHEFGEEIGRASERAAALTAQLLAFSRKQMLKPQVFDVGDLVLKLQRMLARLIREDIAMHVERPQRAWPVLADPAQLEQVVMNLVVNARDAVAAGGTIRLRLCEGDVVSDSELVRGVVLEVHDNGCGMDAATLERVFDPFFTTKAPGMGTGLGLSTVYGIVAQSNGQVEIRSEPGQGTVVRVWLPLVQEQVAETRAAHTTVRGGTERVLVVEDDEQLRQLSQRALQRAGYEVVSAANGELALQLVRAEAGRFDLLVTDVVMPGLNGRELVQAVQQEGYRFPVLYVTGYTEDEIVRRGVAAEKEHLLNKPFPGSVLVRKVREVLDAHEGARPD